MNQPVDCRCRAPLAHDFFLSAGDRSRLCWACPHCTQGDPQC